MMTKEVVNAKGEELYNRLLELKDEIYQFSIDDVANDDAYLERQDWEDVFRRLLR